MRLHRFFITVDLTVSPVRISDPDLLHQWMKVLRLQSGDRLILCDGKGMESEATLVSLEAAHAKLQLHGAHLVAAESLRPVTLTCSVLKRENFEWVVQKCCEVGVKAIVPIVAVRTVKTGLKMDRLRAIAKEAAEQSGRGIIPDIAEPLTFDRALTEAKKYAQNIFFHTIGKQSQSSHLRLRATGGQAKLIAHSSVCLWIGPEGGWTEEEVQQAKNLRFAIGSLGSLTLRAETAAVIAAYLAIREGEYSR